MLHVQVKQCVLFVFNHLNSPNLLKMEKFHANVHKHISIGMTTAPVLMDSLILKAFVMNVHQILIAYHAQIPTSAANVMIISSQSMVVASVMMKLTLLKSTTVSALLLPLNIITHVSTVKSNSAHSARKLESALPAPLHLLLGLMEAHVSAQKLISNQERHVSVQQDFSKIQKVLCAWNVC